jgi:hypothetical protein
LAFAFFVTITADAKRPSRDTDDTFRPRLSICFPENHLHATEQTGLDRRFPNHILVQLCFAREADDACTGTQRTDNTTAPESPSIFTSSALE